MLTWIKIGFLAALVTVSLNSPSWGIPALFLSFITLAARTRFGLREIIRKNIFIAAFALLFGAMAVLSGLLRGTVPYRDMARDFARIVLVYNCVLAGARWIGRNGSYRVIASIPSTRVRMFLLLFGRAYQSLSRSHRSVMDHLRSRLAMKYSDRLLVARYYVQNLMEKEMYAQRHHQAAIITRLTGDPVLAWEKEKVAAADILAFILMTILCAAAAVAG